MCFLLFLALLLCNHVNQACKLETSNSYELNLGNDLVIDPKCTSTSDIESLHWFFLPYVNDSPQNPERNFTSYKDAKTGELRVPDVDKSRNGTYFFTFTNSSTKEKVSSDPISVIIKWYGRETSVSLFSPTMDTLTIGIEVKLTCNFDYNPKPEKVTWLKDGKEVSGSQNVFIKSDVLTIKRLTYQDVGSYMCRVDDIYIELPLTLEIPNGWTTVQLLETGTLCPLAVNEGDDFWIHFRDRGGTFLRNGVKFFNDPKIATYQNGSVFVKEVNRTVTSIDLIGTQFGKTHKCEIYVTYMDAPILEPNTVYFDGGRLNKRRFICTSGASNPPANKFQWFKNGNLLPETETDEAGGSDNTDSSNEIVVTRATNAIVILLPEDYKMPFEKFECVIGNGEKSLSMDLKFENLNLKTTGEDRIYEVMEGDSVRMPCLFQLEDKHAHLFKYEWKSFDEKDDAAFKSLLARSTKSNHDNVLTLNNASLGDSMKLVCAAFGSNSQIRMFTSSNTIVIRVLNASNNSGSGGYDSDSAAKWNHDQMLYRALVRRTASENDTDSSSYDAGSNNASVSDPNNNDDNNNDDDIELEKRFKLFTENKAFITSNKSYIHYLEAGKTSVIPCRAEGPGNEPPSITWYHSDGKLEAFSPFPDGVSVNRTTSDLIFNKATTNQNGLYECVAQLKDKQQQPNVLSMTLDVRVLKEVFLYVLTQPQNKTVKKGDSVEFTCELASDGSDLDQRAGTFWWYNPPPHMSYRLNELYSHLGSSSSNGNNSSSASAPSPVSVLSPIKVETLIKFEEAMRAAESEEPDIATDDKSDSSNNQNVVLDNSDKSKPLPRIRIVNKTKLIIDDVKIDDEGAYYCIFNTTYNYGQKGMKSSEFGHLFVTTAPSASESMRTILIAVACAIGYILFMLALTIYCRKKRIASKNKQLAKATAAGGANNGYPMGMDDGGCGVNQPLVPVVDPFSPRNIKESGMPLQKRLLSIEKLQFPRHELQTTSLLGRGEYGDVFLAVAQGLHLSDSGSVTRTHGRGQPNTNGANSPPPPAANEQLVMIKSLLQKDKIIQEKFQQEMENYAQLRGVNVARLVGVCTEIEPFYMIFEYTEWGDLKRFLMSTKGQGGLPQAPAMALSHKLHIAYQALRGLEYFANHNLVHRDVAARNFLLTPDLTVKLSCASLCKDIYRSEYYEYHNNLIPLRWMPLEAVYDESFSHLSDAYSFGVTLWEIFSLGAFPYHELSNEQVLKGLTVGELKLSVPSNDCPPQVAEIMMKCWEECAINRPSFSQMIAILTSINVDSNC